MTRKEQVQLKVYKEHSEKLIQEHINKTVKSLGYDNENSIAKYLVSSNPFYDECTAISLWIGSVWSTAFSIQTDVEAGARELPTDIIAELPALGI